MTIHSLTDGRTDGHQCFFVPFRIVQVTKLYSSVEHYATDSASYPKLPKAKYASINDLHIFMVSKIVISVEKKIMYFYYFFFSHSNLEKVSGTYIPYYFKKIY